MTDTPYRIIVIDDIREPAFPTGDGIVAEVYRTPGRALDALQKCLQDETHIDELWLDHDMGYDHNGLIDIMPVVQWLEAIAHEGHPLDVSYIFVHTSNGYAGQQMIAALTPHYPKVLKDTLPTERL